MLNKLKVLVVLVIYLSLTNLMITFSMENTTNQNSIPVKLAETYFSDVKQLYDKEDKKLWGKNLYSPMLFIDAETRFVVSNEPDNEGLLKKEGNVYIGMFPKDKIIANSTTNLGGKDYSMVQWQDLGDNDTKRNQLLIHEMFHYQQKFLNLQIPEGVSYNNDHLENMNARIYMKLEWLALERAINSTGEERKNAIIDALSFREFRRNWYNCSKSENMLEILEGLPQYTAIAFCTEPKEQLLKDNMNDYFNAESFVRSFAYQSGPAYGILLDYVSDNWKSDLKYDSDLGEILANIYGFDTLTFSAYDSKNNYEYEDIYKFELSRKQSQDKLIKEYEDRLINNITVKIKLENPNIKFNPNNIIPLNNIGIIYPNIEIIDLFGKLELTTGGCLLSNDWRGASISAKNIDTKENEIVGDGWKITLNSEYTIEKKEDDYIIDRSILNN